MDHFSCCLTVAMGHSQSHSTILIRQNRTGRALNVRSLTALRFLSTTGRPLAFLAVAASIRPTLFTTIG